MRQLTTPRRGLTLVELLASLAITVILFGMAVPYLGDYMANTRLREAGNALHAEMLYAQGEALKRNLTTRLIVEGGDIQVRDMSDGDDGTLLRRRVLGEGVSVLAADVSKTTLRLGAEGGPIDQITIGTQSLARAADQFSTTTLPRLNRAADDTSRAARTLSRTAGGVADNPQLFIYGSGRIPPGPGEPGFAP